MSPPCFPRVSIASFPISAMQFSTESLTETQFQKEDARFVEVPQQTEGFIKEKYLRIFKAQNPSGNYEVDLVLNLELVHNDN